MKRLDDIDFLQFVGKQESQFFARLNDCRLDVHERFQGSPATFGAALPWRKTHDRVRLRPSEVSLWGGINGHGKSLVLSQVALNLLDEQVVVIASMEMPMAATAQRLIRQMLASSTPRADRIDEALTWTDDKLWVYDQLDTVESERILGMCIYAMTELGASHVVIDSLMKCGIGPDDYERQQSFVDRLCWAAKTYGGHIHLVHHVRKGQSEEQIPDKFDVKGAGGITDMVDNVFLMHRNKGKERKRELGQEVPENEPDATLVVAKQRHGEWEGQIGLWFHKDSQQYLPGPNAKPAWYGFLREGYERGVI